MTYTCAMDWGLLIAPPCRYGRRRKSALPTMEITTYVETMYAPGRLNLSPKTVEQYTIAARSLQRFHTETVLVESLCDELVLPWLNARLKQVSPRTVKRERGDLLTVWRWANRKGHCPTGPIDIPHIRCVRKLPAYWRVDELEKLITCQWRPVIGPIWRPSLRDLHLGRGISAETSKRVGASLVSG